MNVQELINKLNTIEDKTKEIVIGDDSEYAFDINDITIGLIDSGDNIYTTYGTDKKVTSEEFNRDVNDLRESYIII